MFNIGDRVRIVSRMTDDPNPMELGTEGTVRRVSDFGDWGQVSVAWDNGRSLMLTWPEDFGVAVVVS